MRPSLSNDAGEGWEGGLLLLACDKSVLMKEEFLAKCEMIKQASYSDLERAWGAFETPSANCVTAALSTRYANTAGIGEASEIWSLAARYQDSGQVMPPSVAKWEKAWYVSFVPEAAEDWADDIQDTYNRMILKTSPEYDAINPPSLLGGQQSAGYRHSLYDTLRKNIEAYTDINVTSEAGASTAGAAPAASSAASSDVETFD